VVTGLESSLENKTRNLACDVPSGLRFVFSSLILQALHWKRNFDVMEPAMEAMTTGMKRVGTHVETRVPACEEKMRVVAMQRFPLQAYYTMGCRSRMRKAERIDFSLGFWVIWGRDACGVHQPC
jgi:hypothetical protein